jgi:bla regulator protein blaR1
MFAWMLYVVMVTLMLSIGAWFAERARLLGKRSTRWVWFTAICASLALPTVIASVSVELPNILAEPVAQRIVVLRQETNALLSPVMWLAGSATPPLSWRSSDPLIERIWWGASLAMLAGVVASGLLVVWRRRQWKRTAVAGADVFVTPATGPAVVGLLRPRIVVPEWLTSADPAQQSAVIAHEQSHLEAGDPQLFTLALALVVLMPWNLPLWWQLRRLRYAIEVDCDARVLRSGVDIKHYGETLITVGEHQSAYIGAVAAMSESRSFLEQRILIMTAKPVRWRHAAATGFIALAIALTGVAAQVSPPNAAETSAATQAPAAAAKKDRVAVKLPAATLDKYVGTYKLNEQAYMDIRREGETLKAQLTGQPAAEIFPERDGYFFWKVVDAQLEFADDGSGSATLHQFGRHLPVTRSDAASAAQAQALLQARIASQTPTPGSEAALRKAIQQIATSTVSDELMEPALAEVLRANAAGSSGMLQHFGAVQNVTFKGVGDQGFDVYEVQHANGKLTYRIAMAPNGKIAGLLSQPSP